MALRQPRRGAGSPARASGSRTRKPAKLERDGETPVQQSLPLANVPPRSTAGERGTATSLAAEATDPPPAPWSRQATADHAQGQTRPLLRAVPAASTATRCPSSGTVNRQVLLPERDTTHRLQPALLLRPHSRCRTCRRTTTTRQSASHRTRGLWISEATATTRLRPKVDSIPHHKNAAPSHATLMSIA